MTCSNCDQMKPTTSAVLNGKFGEYCLDCRQAAFRQASPLSASYNRDRDRETHEKDLIQPWDNKGNPNRDFIRNYPDRANDYYTPEQLAEFG